MSDTFIEGQFSDAEDDDTMFPDTKVEKVENKVSHDPGIGDHGFFTESDDDDEIEKASRDHCDFSGPVDFGTIEQEKDDGDSHCGSEYGASFPNHSSSILLKKEEKSVLTTIEDLEENYTSHYKDQRYDLLVMISSKVFDTNDKKTSVWIEDPTEAHGITILAAFKKEAREMLKEKMKETIEKKNMNEQYVLRDVLISYNQTKQMPTYALLQIEFDVKSTIQRVLESHREPVDYLPIELNMVAKKLQLYKPEQDPPEGIYVDVIVIPVKDFGKGQNAKSPRRIQVIDQSDTKVIWTLWDKDAYNDRAIEMIMHRPIVIRNGIAVKRELTFKTEIQLRKELCATRRMEDFENDRKDFKVLKIMEKLAAWYYQRSGAI